MQVTERTSITRHLEIEALQEIVRWPDAHPTAVVALAGQLLAARRDREGYAYFRERAVARPDQPVFGALEGLFQARLAVEQPPAELLPWLEDALAKLERAAERAPGLPTYFRGLVLAEAGRPEAAVRDLEWVLAGAAPLPAGLRRGALRGLARAYAALDREEDAREALGRSGHASLDAAEPVFVTDAWMTARDGFRFTSPRLVEPAPGVHVAQGYDFGDFAFVVTGDGVVAIDAGTEPAHVEAALAALREVTSAPVRAVVLTHAHADHVGGLEALRGPGVEVIAQANFPNELGVVNGTAAPSRGFFGTAGHRRLDVTPDRLVAARESLTVGGVELVLHPVYGGETSDGLLVHLPARGLLFTGDVMMPYLGSPFLPEGSAAGLFDALRLIRELRPRLLIHGHAPLTESFTIEALPGLEAALRDLHGHVVEAVRSGRSRTDVVRDNHLPAALRAHPAAAIPYLVTRDNFIQRVHRQRTGYWQPDGEGVTEFAPDEWAAALDLVAGGRPEPFAEAAASLLQRGDHALALGVLDLALRRHPDSAALTDLRDHSLARLRERHQALNPFKFIVYSERAGAELPPVR